MTTPWTLLIGAVCLVELCIGSNTGDMNVILGKPFKMTCPDGDKSFQWYIGEGTEVEDRRIAHDITGCMNSFEDRLCTLDANGDLTLRDLKLSDEGLYTCKRGGRNYREPPGYFVRRLHLNVEPEDVEMSAIKNAPENEPFTLTCTVGRIKPATAKIFFKFTDNATQYPAGDVKVHSLVDGTSSMKATLSFTFNRQQKDKRFRCVVQPLPGKGTKKTASQSIKVIWQYNTSATEVSEDEHPILGEDKKLRCDIVNEGFPVKTTYRWIHNGKNVKGSNRHEGTSEQVLTIKGLRRDDSGKYDCSILNKAGSGNCLHSFQLNVWYPYSSSVRESSSSEVPLVGETKSLTCDTAEEGYPADATGSIWYRNERKISNDGANYIITQKELKIVGLTKEDMAIYSCGLLSPAGEGTCTDKYHLTVFCESTVHD